MTQRIARNAIATCAVLLGLVLADTLRTDAQAPQSDPRTTAPQAADSPQRTLINQYCVACHNDRLKSGGMANSDAHNNDPLPQALIGRGGGVKGNQHLHYKQDTPHANILVTMLSRAGVPAEEIEKFADNTGVLSNV